MRVLKSGEWSRDPYLSIGREALFASLREKYPTAQLGSLGTFINGRSYDSSQLADEGTPIIRISNISDPKGTYIRTREQFDSRWLVQEGDLLASWSASFKTIIWPGPTGMLNQHIFKVEEADGVSRAFLRHAIEASYDEMLANSVGIGMKHLRRRDVLGHAVPCPPPDVQSSVAETLEWLAGGRSGPLPTPHADLQLVIGSVQRSLRVVEAAEEIRTRRIPPIRTLLGQRIGTGQEARILFVAGLRRFQERYAQEGALACLGDFLSEPPRSGPSFSVTTESRDTAVIMPAATTGFRFSATAINYAPDDVQLSEKDILRDGDILFPRGNKPDQVGNTGVYRSHPERATFANLFMRLRLHSSIWPEFANYWFMTPLVRQHVRSHTKGTSPSVQKINSTGVRSIPFPSPPALQEQIDVCEKLTRIREQADKLEALIANQARTVSALAPALLASSVRETRETECS